MQFGPLPRFGKSTHAVASSRRQAQLPFSSLLPFLSSGREGLGLFCSLKDTFRKIRKRGGLQQQSLRAVIILQVRAKRKGQLDSTWPLVAVPVQVRSHPYIGNKCAAVRPFCWPPRECRDNYGDERECIESGRVGTSGRSCHGRRESCATRQGCMSVG